MIVQTLAGAVHPAAIPQPNILTLKGVLVPTAADGFYSKRDDAIGVAEYMADEHPDLDIYVAAVTWARVHEPTMGAPVVVVHDEASDLDPVGRGARA